MSNKNIVLKELIEYADHLDRNGFKSIANLFDFAINTISDLYKNTDIIKSSDDARVVIAKCADYMDGRNKIASDILDKVLKIALEDIPGRYGPISQFSRQEHSDMVYNTESTLPKQEKRKRNDQPNIKEYGEAGNQLNTRYCPDHNGVQTVRVGERVYQCPLDKKTYNYETGYTNYKGENIPGGSVAHQTPEDSDYFAIPSRIFDSRDSLMNPIT